MNDLIESTLQNLRAPVTVLDSIQSPQVTTYRCRPGKNTRIRKVQLRAPDLAMVLGVSRVNVVGLPGAIGIEVPRKDREFVKLDKALVRPLFLWEQREMALPIAFGVDQQYKVVVKDLAEFPHLLIAGQTGSGKSIAVHSIIRCLLSMRSREQARLILIDPKRVELGVYQGRDQVLGVQDDMYQAGRTLNRACGEMDKRYRELKRARVRDISGLEKYRIVIVIDELADLMLQYRAAEQYIVRLAQLGRAAGIHLVVATQRPTVDVVTGLIKANFPGRLAFQTASKVDSRVVLDRNGAEELLGKGDGLLSVGGEVVRIQGCY